MGKNNLVRIYENVYKKEISYCALCYRSYKETRLVKTDLFKNIVDAIRSSNAVVYNEKLCYICEAHLKNFAYILDNIQLALEIHRVFRRAEATTGKDFTLKRELMKENLKQCQKKLIKFRDKIQFQKSDVMIVDNIESDLKPLDELPVCTPEETNIQPLKPEKSSPRNKPIPIPEENIEKDLITIDILTDVPPIKPQQIPGDPPEHTNIKTNHEITNKPKKNTKTKFKPGSIITQTKLNLNKTYSYMPVLTIDGSSGTPETRLTNLPIIPTNIPIKKAKKNNDNTQKKEKSILGNLLRDGDYIGLEYTRNVSEEPVKKKIKNTPQLFIKNNKKYLTIPIVAHRILKKNIKVIKNIEPTSEIDKTETLLPTIVDCRTDENAFRTEDKEGTESEIEDSVKIVDIEDVPTDMKTFVDCGDRSQPLCKHNIDKTVLSGIKNNFGKDITSIIIVENKSGNTICNLCAREVTSETLKDHFIKSHMKTKNEVV